MALQLSKDNETTVIPLRTELVGTTVNYDVQDYVDSCGTGGGVREVQADGSLKIVNHTESADVMETSMRARDWYQKGI